MKPSNIRSHVASLNGRRSQKEGYKSEVESNKTEEDCAESPKLETNYDRRKGHKTDDVYVPPYFDCLHITHDSYSVFSHPSCSSRHGYGDWNRTWFFLCVFAQN